MNLTVLQERKCICYKDFIICSKIKFFYSLELPEFKGSTFEWCQCGTGHEREIVSRFDIPRRELLIPSE